MAALRAKYRGTWNYYGLIGNGKSLQAFYYWTVRVLHKWLNRRSQRPGMSWARLQRLLKRYEVPTPRITESRIGSTQLAFRWTEAQAEASSSEEPGAVVPHAGICAGGTR